MNERREYPGPIQLLDGRLLVVSGHAIAGRSLKSAELFDPVTKRWAPTADMHNARQGGGGVVLLDGRIFVGESFGVPAHFPSEIYRPATADWIVAAKMNEGRQNCTLTRLSDGRVLATGGIDWSTDTTLASAEIYDPGSNTWTRTAPLDRPRLTHVAISLPDGRVMIVGGGTYPNPFDVPLATTIYDPKTASWSPGPTMGRTYYVAASVQCKPSVSGGLLGSHRCRSAARRAVSCAACGTRRLSSNGCGRSRRSSQARRATASVRPRGWRRSAFARDSPTVGGSRAMSR